MCDNRASQTDVNDAQLQESTRYNKRVNDARLLGVILATRVHLVVDHYRFTSIKIKGQYMVSLHWGTVPTYIKNSNSNKLRILSK